MLPPSGRLKKISLLFIVHRFFSLKKNPSIYKDLLVFLSLVPNSTRNGFEGVIQRSLRPAFEDRVCFIATVRLAKPQFIKVG